MTTTYGFIEVPETLLEVRPKYEGWYRVTLYQYSKENPEHPDYFQEWVEFTGGQWSYMGYEGSCYVCFIHSKEY